MSRILPLALLAGVVAGLAVAMGACGGGGEPPTRPGDGGTPATATPASLTPQELGLEVTQHYFEALDKLGTILDKDLPADTLRLEVHDLKAEYIETFVSYGYQREAMTTSDRDAFDVEVRQTILLATPSALDKLSAAVTSLNEAGKSDLANEISSINIITQYAFFDLLKKQEPEEAQRLGIP